MLEALGLDKEPMGVFYTDHQPTEGFFPKPGVLYSAEQEAKGEINYGQAFSNFSCVIGNVWLAWKKKTLAWFDREHFGCCGGAFYLGFQKPQLEVTACYVSTGIPGRMEGERYFESPQSAKEFFEAIDPRPAPARYCVIKPLSLFTARKEMANTF